MASTKAVTAMEQALTLTADAVDDVGTSVDLSDGYGAAISAKITNGATGPTLPAQILHVDTHHAAEIGVAASRR